MRSRELRGGEALKWHKRGEERGWLKRGKEGLQLVTRRQSGGPGGCVIHRSALSSLAEYT